ncbi:MAG TPA: hypothetical protein VEL69_06260 [Ktedonobacteraceae bacterium]|nr:hypothetical protein [Ktedonobacteraceae bacterium]
MKKQLDRLRAALPAEDEEVGTYDVEFDAQKLLPDERQFIEALPHRRHSKRGSYLIDIDNHTITRPEAECLDEITDRIKE